MTKVRWWHAFRDQDFHDSVSKIMNGAVQAAVSYRRKPSGYFWDTGYGSSETSIFMTQENENICKVLTGACQQRRHQSTQDQHSKMTTATDGDLCLTFRWSLLCRFLLGCFLGLRLSAALRHAAVFALCNQHNSSLFHRSAKSHTALSSIICQTVWSFIDIDWLSKQTHQQTNQFCVCTISYIISYHINHKLIERIIAIKRCIC